MNAITNERDLHREIARRNAPGYAPPIFADVLTYNRDDQQAASDVLAAITNPAPRPTPAICWHCGTVRSVAGGSSPERLATLWCGHWACRQERTHQVG